MYNQLVKTIYDFLHWKGENYMRQIKIIQSLSLSHGVEGIETEINEALREIDTKGGTIKCISYPTQNDDGQVNSAVIEFDI